MSKLSNTGTVAPTFLDRLLYEPQESTSLEDGTFAAKRRVSRTYQIAKRGLDIGGALVGLIILALLLLISIPLIWMEDRGTIFYRQIRVGRYGRPFTTYKLRSMIMDADHYLTQHPELLRTWRHRGKLEEDPRITHVGKFLRRTSLDEMPQMWNVLRGEMSLVGPRAIQFSEEAAFGELGALRLTVKPGLTGLWQICGRSQTTYEQRCLLDCMYVMECSFGMDLHILCKTLPVVICGTGAY